MIYPIFNSIVNTLESEFAKRDIKLKNFRTWNEDRINATGLEILIDLEGSSDFFKALSINFDWDRFRETTLARQLEGMEEHPFLQDKNQVKSTISPIIDIEVSWIFDERACQPAEPGETTDHRIEAAGNWMEQISKEINNLLADDDIITRWHIEIEGDEYGKYLSAINLISYFQYTLTTLSSLNEVQRFVTRRLQELLIKANKVVKLSETTLATAA